MKLVESLPTPVAVLDADAAAPRWCNRAARAAEIDAAPWNPPADAHVIPLSGGRQAWVWPDGTALATAARLREQLQEFIYAVSHDLQAPSRTVAAYLDLLVEDEGDALPEQAHEYIDFAVGGANRIRDLLGGLLGWSRVDSQGRMLVPTSANDAFDVAVHQLRDRIGAEDRVSRADLPEVMADPAQLLDLIEQLLDNSLKFRGGQPANVRVSAERDGARWRFSVRDRGIGIEPRFHARVLRMFQRLHAEGAYPGVGAGLAICLRIVERHGGRIWFDSHVDGGVTCNFTLAAPAAAEG